MADIELVIKIDESLLDGIKSDDFDFARRVVKDFQATIADAIKNGTVLPKHGRLGDLDYLYKKFESNGCKDSNVYRLIKDEPTILEATGVEECTHTQ